MCSCRETSFKRRVFQLSSPFPVFSAALFSVDCFKCEHEENEIAPTENNFVTEDLREYGLCTLTLIKLETLPS